MKKGKSVKPCLYFELVTASRFQEFCFLTNIQVGFYKHNLASHWKNVGLRLHRSTAPTQRRPLRRNLCPEHLILYILHVLAHVLRTTGVVCVFFQTSSCMRSHAARHLNTQLIHRQQKKVHRYGPGRKRVTGWAGSAEANRCLIMTNRQVPVGSL